MVTRATTKETTPTTTEDRIEGQAITTAIIFRIRITPIIKITRIIKIARTTKVIAEDITTITADSGMYNRIALTTQDKETAGLTRTTIVTLTIATKITLSLEINSIITKAAILTPIDHIMTLFKTNKTIGGTTTGT